MQDNVTLKDLVKNYGSMSGYNRYKAMDTLTLSKAQEEYFANSVIRRDDGKLMICCHYTDKTFDTFDVGMIGKGQGDSGYCGKGFYFTFMSGFGRCFGEKCLPCFINITNPLIVEELEDYKKEELLRYFAERDEYKRGDLPRVEGHPQNWEKREFGYLKDIIEYHDFENSEAAELAKYIASSSEYSEFKQDKNIDRLLQLYEFKCLKDMEEFQDEVNKYHINDYVELEVLGIDDLTSNKFHWGTWVSYAACLTEWAKDNGYDGILSERTESGEIREIVVFEPNQIKAIDNLYPTKDDNFKDNSDEYLNSDKCNSLKERLEVLKYIFAKAKEKDDDGGTAPAAHCRGRDEAELI